ERTCRDKQSEEEMTIKAMRLTCAQPNSSEPLPEIPSTSNLNETAESIVVGLAEKVLGVSSISFPAE
ncbi:hypothetical protein KUCAC02_000710, partial [Chaenocephalus aceratus]